MYVYVNLKYDISFFTHTPAQSHITGCPLLKRFPPNQTAVIVYCFLAVLCFSFCLFVCNLQLISYVCVCVFADARLRLSFTRRRIFFTDNLLSVYICVICCCSSILSTSNEFVSAANSLFVYR